MILHKSLSLRLRWGLKHPLTWLWVLLSAGISLAWLHTGALTSLVLWQKIAVGCFAVLGLLWAELEVQPLDGWIKKHPAPALLLSAVCSFFTMEISIENTFTNIIPLGYLWGISIPLAVSLLLYAVLGRVWSAGLSSAVLFLIWGLGSYYTLFFRGLPLMPNDLMSMGTAADVLGNYTLPITPAVLSILFLFLCQLQVFLSLRCPRAHRRWQQALAVRLGCAAACAGWLWGFCIGPFTPARFRFYEFNWKENCYYQGYLPTIMMRLDKLVAKPPAAYSEQKAAQLLDEMKPAPSKGQTPDLVLIVNESWFDWNQLTDFTTDRPVMPFIDSLTNCVRGFAVNPNLSTSGAEYELLTSNSTVLMPSITPFTQMNLSGTNSLVKHLEQLGYSSVSYHPANAANYNRRSVYPYIGFDTSWFWDWDNEDPSYAVLESPLYVHNGMSDKSCFDYMIELYEKRDPSRPAFLYNLTYQNHGGYEQADFNGGSWHADPEHRITVTSGFNAVRGQAEEYLTCLSYTDTAFAELIEYFSVQENPVVVCMVGDHIPHFTEDVASPYTGLEYQMRSRGTPFVIWANYPLPAQEAGYVGMVQLAPLLLETAGVELSPYYQSILELSKEFPVISRDIYQDSSGQLAPFISEQAADLGKAMRRYIFFESAAITKSSRLGNLFLPWNTP